jgi:hypothetical protein
MQIQTYFKLRPSSTVKGADTKNIDSLPQKLTDKYRQSPTKSSSTLARNLRNPTFHFTHFSTSFAVSQHLKALGSLNMTHHTMIARAHAHPHRVLLKRFYNYEISYFTLVVRISEQ